MNPAGEEQRRAFIGSDRKIRICSSKFSANSIHRDISFAVQCGLLKGRLGPESKRSVPHLETMANAFTTSTLSREDSYKPEEDLNEPATETII